MRAWVVALLALAPLPAAAEVDHAALAERALNETILPGFERLAAATGALAAAAEAACAGEGPIEAGPVMAGFDDAFDAWIGVEAFRFGPAQEDNAGFALAFWPDTKGSTPRTLAGDDRGGGPGGGRPGGLRRAVGGGAGVLRARLAALRPGGGADRGGELSLPAAGGDHPGRGGDVGADAGAVAGSLGGDPDQRRGGGQSGLFRAGGVEQGALRGADRGAAGGHRPAAGAAARDVRAAAAAAGGGVAVGAVAPERERLAGGAAELCATACSGRRCPRARSTACIAGSTRRWRRSARVGEPIDVAVATTQGRVRVEALQSSVRQCAEPRWPSTSARGSG